MTAIDHKLQVFLCHSSHDKLTVYELYERLNGEGWIDAWLDAEKLYPGQDWNYEIEKAVEGADVILVCISKDSVTKEGYVQRELRIVLDLADYKPEGTLFVIPVRLEVCEPPRRLRIWQYADYFPEEDRDRAYARLLVSLQRRARHLGILVANPIDEKSRLEAKEQDKEAKERARKKQQERARILEEKARPEKVEPSKHAIEALRLKQEAEEREKFEKEKLNREQSEWILPKNNIAQNQIENSSINISEYPQGKNTTLIIVVTSTILITLCCIVTTLVWQYGDALLSSF